MKFRKWEVMKMMIIMEVMLRMEAILRMEMIATLSSKVRDGMDPHTFFSLSNDKQTLDQCT